jgi:hypothetical protein
MLDSSYEISDISVMADVFSIFHDGCFEEVQQDNKLLCLKVGVEYLAELVIKGNTFFYLELDGVSELKFIDWDKKVLAGPQNIFGTYRGIARAEVRDDLIVIYVNDNGPEEPGGEVSMKISKMKILDEQKTLISFDELVKLSDSYWSKFSS